MDNGKFIIKQYLKTQDIENLTHLKIEDDWDGYCKISGINDNKQFSKTVHYKDLYIIACKKLKQVK